MLKAFCHREALIWFVTPDGKVIFQKRSMQKSVDPGMFGAAVGGHVESGKSAAETALIETIEETGLNLTSDMIAPLVRYRFKYTHPVTGLIDNVMQTMYGYVYNGSLSDLKVEAGEGSGFVAVPYEDLLQHDVMERYPMTEFLYAFFTQVKDKLPDLMHSQKKL